MSDMTELVHRYLEIWNEADPAAREQAIVEVWTPDGTYTDPLQLGEPAPLAPLPQQVTDWSAQLSAGAHAAKLASPGCLTPMSRAGP